MNQNVVLTNRATSVQNQLMHERLQHVQLVMNTVIEKIEQKEQVNEC